MAAGGWQIREETRDDVLRRLFGRDPVLSGYALADLEPPHRQHTTIHVASRAVHDDGWLLSYAPGSFTALMATGSAEAVAFLLDRVTLPTRSQIICQQDHAEIVRARFETETWHAMHRMTSDLSTMPALDASPDANRLGVADLPALRELYAARDYFAPLTEGMLLDDTYHGIWQDGRLLAAAGTHVVARQAGVAAIGNVYTRPEARGQGLGRAVMMALVARLRALGCHTAILNVATTNAPAIALYERLGFHHHVSFWEIDDARPRAAGLGGIN